MWKKLKIKFFTWLLDDYIDDILTNYTEQVVKQYLKKHQLF